MHMDSRAPHIHIASFVLHAQPDAVESLRNALGAFAEIEVVAHDPSGKLVFLIEADSERRVADVADALRLYPGVFAVSMVEHHVDAVAAMMEEVTP
jgi:nitrate reductase NapD